MKHSIDLNESEIHILRLAIKTILEEFDEYLNDPAVDQDWGLTKEVLAKTELYHDLSLRFDDLAHRDHHQRFRKPT